MKSNFVQLWIFTFVWCVCVYHVDSYINLISNFDVPGVYQRSAELLCKVESDKPVKEVIWYRLSDNEATKIVYYYEPPKYNAPSPEYADRALLAEDSSSLILRSIDLKDEATYECHVAVVHNVTSPDVSVIPEETSVTMKLNVYVPPTDIKLTTFHSGKNLTLTCRAAQTKPPADISWIVTRKDGSTRKLQPSKMISEFNGNLADTIGYLYWSLHAGDEGISFTCVADHPETSTVLKRNVTLVAPALLYPVDMEFDWLGETVPYSTHSNVDSGSEEIDFDIPGLVRMQAHPATIVKFNNSVVVTISAKGAFPEPTYTWWAEDLGQTTGKERRIKRLTKSVELFCLVENPVGRAVMSIEITATDTDPIVDVSDPSAETAEGGVLASGAVVAAIAFGGLLILFLLAFVIYYFAFRRTSEKKTSDDDVGIAEGNDFDEFVEKQKPVYSSSAPREPPEGVRTKRSDPGAYVAVQEDDPLLKSGLDTPPPPFHSRSNGSTPIKKVRGSRTPSASSATTTSGYSDTGNGRNETAADGVDETPPTGKERAITKHLQDFDENASFLGEYGSTFALDNAPLPRPIEVEARTSPFDGSDVDNSYSDASSLNSAASGNEGRYTLPHSSSWEDINPNHTVNTPV